MLSAAATSMQKLTVSVRTSKLWVRPLIWPSTATVVNPSMLTVVPGAPVTTPLSQVRLARSKPISNTGCACIPWPNRPTKTIANRNGARVIMSSRVSDVRPLASLLESCRHSAVTAP